MRKEIGILKKLLKKLGKLLKKLGKIGEALVPSPNDVRDDVI